MKSNFSWSEMKAMAEKVRRMGNWTGVRWLRNKGVSFADAHLIVLGYEPRIAE